MNINFCTDSDKDFAKKIWRECFPRDSAAFIDFYFDNVHSGNNSLILKDNNGTPCSYMGMPQYEMRFCGHQVKTVYLSGISTLSEHRGKGYMTAMMSQALETMYQRGVLISVLIPADAGLYTRYGYAYCYFHSHQNLSGDGKENDAVRVNGDTDFDGIYESCMSGLNGCIKRTPRDWYNIINEHKLVEGKIYTTDNAYAFAGIYGDRTVVKEMCCVNEEERQKMISHILYHHKSARFVLPLDKTLNIKPFAQARIINAMEILKIISKGKRFTITICDGYIEQNNRTFRADNQIITECDGEGQACMDIYTFTLLCFGAVNPQKARLCGLFEGDIDGIFEERTNYINLMLN